MEKKEFLEFIGDKILLNDFEIIKLSDFIKGCDKRDSKMLQDIAELVLCFNRPNAKMLFSAILTIIEGKVKQSVEKSALSNFQGSKWEEREILRSYILDKMLKKYNMSWFKESKGGYNEYK